MSSREILRKPTPRLQLWLSLLVVGFGLIAVLIAGSLRPESTPPNTESPRPSLRILYPERLPYFKESRAWGRGRAQGTSHPFSPGFGHRGGAFPTSASRRRFKPG